MAKRTINWTSKALLERKDILSYWIERNKSKSYSIKLDKLFLEALSKIANNPYIGKKTQFENIRVKNVRDYLLIYEFDEKSVKVLTLWSTYREEGKLKL